MEAEITATPTSALASPTLEEFLVTPIGRKMPPVTRAVASKLASGDAPERIARALGIPTEIVNRHIREIIRFFPCQPSQSAGNGTATRPAKRPSSGAANLGARRFMVEAKCEGCGTRIKKGDERVVLAAFETGYRQLDDEELLMGNRYADGEEGLVYNADLRSVFHYCGSCRMAEELHVRNPWSMHSTAEDIKRLEEWETEMKAEAAAESEHLSKVVAAGDMHGFNTAMPTTPKRDDALGRSVLFSRVVEKAEVGREQRPGSGGDDEVVSPNEVIDVMASTESPDSPSPYGPGAIEAGEAVQRAKVREYLDSPRSRGKVSENERKAARLWLEGQTQETIARKLGIRDRSTVSRYRQSVIQKALAPR